MGDALDYHYRVSLMNQTTVKPAYLPDEPVWQSLFIGVLILGACILGIASRLLLDLASFWPANALVLGILAYRPDTNRPLTWLAVAAAYLPADLLAGTERYTSVLINSANLVGVATGVVVCRMVSPDTLRLNRPVDAIMIILIMALAAGAAAGVGVFAGTSAFGLSVVDSLALWFSTEFVNYALVFPVLSAMVSHDELKFRLFSRNRSVAWRQAAALGFLVLSYLAVHFAGGPGVITYMLPALGWVAVRFRPFATAIITLAVCTALMVAGQNGSLHLHFDVKDIGHAASFRFGIAMVAITAFALATLNAAWRRVHFDLQLTSRHDALTGLLNRAAFIERAHAVLDYRREMDPVSLLMLDIDHFKSVNDRFGHAAGDSVLASTAKALSTCLRSDDVIARLGGEEFVVILPGVGAADARATAERLRRAIEELDILLPNGDRHSLTISVGGSETRTRDALASLMSSADAALYAAKRAGRNRVVMVAGEEQAAETP